MTIFQKLFINLYRGLAIVILAAVLLSALTYFLILIFFSLHTGWGAPVILTKSSPRIASMSSEVLRAEQMIDAMDIQVTTAQDELALMQAQYSVMEDLVKRYEQSLAKQMQEDEQMSRKLSHLGQEKNRADALLSEALRQNRAMLQQVDKEVKAGLITSEDAARLRAQAANAEASLQAALSSGRAATTTMQYQAATLGNEVATLGGQASSTKALESIARLSQLHAELAQTQNKMKRANLELKLKQQEMQKLRSLLQTLSHSPYHRAATSKQDSHTFAFVPYDNQKAVSQSTPVYACVLQIVWCQRVGQVTTVTQDEERLRHPVFPSDMRGFLVDLKLDDVNAAKEKVLFFGTKPLFF